MGQSPSSAEKATESVAPPSEPQAASGGGISPMVALITEASAYSGDENESLEARAVKALECPCVADLRSGPCGESFTAAFLCFMKSTEEEKGSDCKHPFVALQQCITEHPDAFSKDILGEDDEEEVVGAVDVRQMRAPRWAQEVQSKM